MLEFITREKLLQLVRRQISHYPGFELLDLYKMLYQAANGNEHLTDNETTFRSKLYEEWMHLTEPMLREHLIDDIDPQGQWIRIHLRPFKHEGGSPEQMTTLSIRSMNNLQKQDELLIDYWNAVFEMTQDMELPLTVREMAHFWNDLEKQGFPPVHHSDKYRRIHKPHYRLVLRRFWEGV